MKLMNKTLGVANDVLRVYLHKMLAAVPSASERKTFNEDEFCECRKLLILALDGMEKEIKKEENI